uniref:CYC02 protein n=1 Tax=Anthurium amnicola TaxID=1678845 RepID=A0A1D1XMY5_9ARAE
MAPRALLVVFVLMAALLFISFEVAATEMAEDAPEEQTKDAVKDQNGGRCRYGCCGWHHGRCRKCCAHKSEVADAVVEGAEDAVSDQKHRCPHGCCKWHHGRCIRCCRN